MPATYANRSVNFGVNRTVIWRVNASGYATGIVENPTANTTTSALVDDSPKTVTVPSAPRTQVTATGGNKAIAKTSFPPSDLPNGEMTIGALNIDLLALVAGAAVDTTTNQRWARTAPNNNRVVLPNVGIMLTGVDQSLDVDTEGTTFFWNYIIPNCTLSFTLPNPAFQAQADVSATITPNFARREPTGRLFSAGGMGLEDGKEFVYVVKTPKPLMLTTFISNGSATTFTLPYRPTSNVVTLNNTPNEFARNGVLQALSSISTTTGVATMAASGTAGDINVLWYETDFVPVS